MKQDLVIHSSDSNPFYLDFWPLVSKVWKLKFGVTPLLVYIDDNHDIPIDTTQGDVIKMKPVPGIPVYFQCLWVRQWIPSQYPERICMISDIDMFPISRPQFIDAIQDIPDTKQVHLYPCDQMPSCQHVAKGSLFQKVLDLHRSWEDSVTYLWNANLGHHAYLQNTYNPILKGKTQWGADETQATYKIRTYVDPSCFVFLNRSHGRIDRSHWVWNPIEIQQDRQADSHSIRPYSQQRREIDSLVTAILEGSDGNTKV